MESGNLNAVGQLEHDVKKDPYRFSRAMAMTEALVEYLISLTITGAFLAKITEAIGISDSLTGIITAFLSLANVFQLFAVLFVGLKRVKAVVTTVSVIKHSFFAFLYILPLTPLDRSLQTLIFMVLLLVGYMSVSIFFPCKTNWIMSLVDTRGRGIYTARKEMISLVFGMLYSLLIGNVVTYFEKRNELKTAFIICAITIFVFTVVHAITLLLIKEKNTKYDHLIAVPPEPKTKFNLKDFLCDKRLLKVSAVYILWNIANYITTPFYGTYQNKELGFTLAFVSIISVLSSISRFTVSIPIGRFADKHSFTKMLTLTFSVAAFSFLICSFATPANGKVLFTLYSVTHCIALAGINGGSVNLLYEYVETENKTGALAFNFAASGLAGFLSTLAISPLVNYVQAKGNTFLGMNIYAQQLVSLIGFLVTVLTIVYLNTVVKKMKSEKIKKER